MSADIISDRFVTVARTAKVRYALMPNGSTIHVYDKGGNETVGRLQRQPDGRWRGFPDVSGAATEPIADTADALAALLRAVAADALARSRAAHPSGGAR